MASGCKACSFTLDRHLTALLPPAPPNDNALIPRSYQFDSYLAGESKDLSLLETIVYGYKVDFACLTAQFGANLRRSLFEPRERLPIEAVTR